VKKVAADFANFAMLQTKVRPEYSPLSPLIGFSPPFPLVSWPGPCGFLLTVRLRARKRADEPDVDKFHND